jgi:hypothetical protein
MGAKSQISVIFGGEWELVMQVHKQGEEPVDGDIGRPSLATVEGNRRGEERRHVLQ